MNYKPYGHNIEVGDIIEVCVGRTPFRYDHVTRVTKTMAVCEKPGQLVPPRYPRVYGFGFKSLPYHRSNISYRVIDK